MPGYVERDECEDLRRMFLPRVTHQGREKLQGRSPRNAYVHGILKHYGVHFTESEITGTGEARLRKALLAGECDKVPDRNARLRDDMHAEWLDKLTPAALSHCPKWIGDKYFLTAGQPDRTKTTSVVGIPTNRYSMHTTVEICKEAAVISGLHHAQALGPKTTVVFMGWDKAAVDKAAVDKAADGHPPKETKKLEAAQKALDKKRDQQHQAYLDTLAAKQGPHTYSPVGKYIVRCPEIEDQWPDDAKRLTLSIRPTPTPELFEADFHFGVIEGIMVLSTSADRLELRMAALGEVDSEDDEDEEEDDDDGDEEGEKEVDEDESKEEHSTGDGGHPSEDVVVSPTGPKRLAEACETNHPAKKAKLDAPARPPPYLVRLKCRETLEGEIQPYVCKGSITFDDQSLVSFTAQAGLAFVGTEPFTGRKVSDDVGRGKHSWHEFSWEAFEFEKGRWHSGGW
ncbi:hypothetical protein SPI_03646 [Niveomyces insectorum RCEF 264]|uniref:Uncharacterized protein n=1 Tax=Niveomyces insectorum RCEF 264 TaxID=1081102 RepID=A0A167W8Y0_9HYPO|nr:hypothetical protein SPI_03646 [Niveomyces insectorum RCEF 264]